MLKFDLSKLLRFSPTDIMGSTYALFGQAVRNMSDNQRKALFSNLENYCKTNGKSTASVGSNLMIFWNNDENSVKKLH